MRLMVKRLAAAASVVVAIANSGMVLACTCARRPPAELLERASFVVQAVVVDREAPSARRVVFRGDTMAVTSSLDMARYRLAVVAVWKGEVENEETAYSRRDSDACGLPLKMRKEYLLFLRPHDGVLKSPAGVLPKPIWAGAPEFPAKTFGLCNGSCGIERAAEMLEFLGQPMQTFELPEGLPKRE